VGGHRAVQRVVDKHPWLAEAARRRAEGLDLLVGADGIVELEQQADAPQAHLHPELGVLRALAQLERLDRDRQAAGHGLGPPDRDEALRERERQRAVAEHAVRPRAARGLAGVQRPRDPERLIDEPLTARALGRPVQRQRKLDAQAAVQRVDRRAAQRLLDGRHGLHAAQRLLERRDELGFDEARRERPERAGERGLGEALGVVEPACVPGGGAQRALRAIDVARAHPRLPKSLRELPGAPLVDRQRGGHVERALVQARGLLVGELHDGPLRRARRVVDRALGATLGRRLQVVMRDHGEVLLEVVAVRLLQRLGDDAVQPRAARGAEALQQRVAHERVRELVAAGVAAGVDDPAAQRHLEPLEHRFGRLAQHAREWVQAELAADHGGGTERFQHDRLQRVQAPADRVAHAIGQRQRTVGGAAVVQASLRGEQLHELVDEERVARARLVHRRDEPRRDRLALAAAQPACARLCQQPDLVATQALERQPRRSAGQSAERGREIGPRVRLGVAVGGDRQQRDVGQRASDKLQRQQRRGIGPVQVVEDDDEGALLGDRRQQRDERVEEPEARLVGVELGGLGGRAERPRQLGQQARDPGRALAERDAQCLRVGAPPDRAPDLHPGPVRRCATPVPAAAPGPLRPAGGDVLDELARQRGLADARLSRQQDQAAAAGERLLQARVELCKLASAPHEARTAPSAHGRSVHSILPARQTRRRHFGASP
jgi:hypothetical protein